MIDAAGGTASRTSAARIAGQIEGEIARAGWRVGQAIGSEALLMERYRVGRSVLREAIRILESRSVARPRPGPGGGLVVTSPRPEGVRDAARTFLDYSRATRDHLFQTWSALEVVAAADLAGSIDAAGIAALRATLRAEEAGSVPSGAVHLEIARLAGNPATELFIRVVADLAGTHRGTGTGAAAGERPRAHRELVDAIVSGDAPLAQHLVRRCLREDQLATDNASEDPPEDAPRR